MGTYNYFFPARDLDVELHDALLSSAFKHCESVPGLTRAELRALIKAHIPVVADNLPLVSRYHRKHRY